MNNAKKDSGTLSTLELLVVFLVVITLFCMIVKTQQSLKSFIHKEDSICVKETKDTNTERCKPTKQTKI
jgi:hypothetical protein